MAHTSRCLRCVREGLRARSCDTSFVPWAFRRATIERTHGNEKHAVATLPLSITQTGVALASLGAERIPVTLTSGSWPGGRTHRTERDVCATGAHRAHRALLCF